MAEHAQTARGHEEPFAVQFSVFLANRVGRLKELLELLDDQEVPVVGLSIVDSSDWAVVRMISSETGKAREVLRSHGIPFMESRVLLVVLNEERAVTEVCTLLLAAEMNIHFVYPLTIRREDRPVLVVHVEDYVGATEVLARHGLTLVGDEDLNDRRNQEGMDDAA